MRDHLLLCAVIFVAVGCNDANVDVAPASSPSAVAAEVRTPAAPAVVAVQTTPFDSFCADEKNRRGRSVESCVKVQTAAKEGIANIEAEGTSVAVRRALDRVGKRCVERVGNASDYELLLKCVGDELEVEKREIDATARAAMQRGDWRTVEALGLAEGLCPEGQHLLGYMEARGKQTPICGQYSNSVPSALPSAFGSSSSRSRDVSVRGYTKKDGTYVAPHTRSAPKKN